MVLVPCFMDDLALWQKPGVIASEALYYGAHLIKEGVLLLDVANKVEAFVRSKGGRLAFPVGLSVNDMAAHYTPAPNDPKVFAKGDLVKIDVGVHVDGYIADNARTVLVGGGSSDILDASLHCLQAATKLVKPGTAVREIGAAVHDVAKDAGFNPVRNLSGHGVARWKVHAGMTIPNYDNGDETQLKAGQMIAIEPFVTAGSGFVKEGAHSTIYRFDRKAPVRDRVARDVLNFILAEFKTLPFSKLAIANEFGVQKATRGLMMLDRARVIYGYAQLPDRDGQLVTQHENSFFVTKTGHVITTPFKHL